MQLGDFEVNVSIEGQEAPEYDIKTSNDERLVSCFIASEEGKARCTLSYLP